MNINTDLESPNSHTAMEGRLLFRFGSKMEHVVDIILVK